MSLLGEIVAGLGLGGGTLSRSPAWLTEALGLKSSAGQTVNVQKALGLVPVYSAVSGIAADVGSLPLIVYSRSEVGKDRDEDHDAWRLLHDRPNAQMAADEVWEIVVANLNLWGNAFIWKRKTATGTVGELWPLDPGRLQVGWDENANRQFVVDSRPGFTEDDILHIRGLSQDGCIGYSPVQLAKEAIGVMLAQQAFQGEFLGNGGRPAVILRHPNRLKDDAKTRLKASWDAIKRGGTAVLEEAIEVQNWTMPLDDAQFIEQEQLSDLRVAQLFHYPPHRLGAKTGDSLTYSTTEMEGADYVRYTLRRWLTRIEGSLRRDADILGEGGHFAEFLVDALLRADTKTRYQAHMLGLNAGFLGVEEVRAMENLPPREEPDQPPQEGDTA